MTIHIRPTAIRPQPNRRGLRQAWRNWWLRAAKARQTTQLNRVLTDPHMARDLGLPVVERPKIHRNLW